MFDGLKETVGSLRSWLWWYANYEEGEPIFCERLKIRMICQFCPHHVVEKTPQHITSYCGPAYKEKWGSRGEIE